MEFPYGSNACIFREQDCLKLLFFRKIIIFMKTTIKMTATKSFFYCPLVGNQPEWGIDDADKEPDRLALRE